MASRATFSVRRVAILGALIGGLPLLAGCGGSSTDGDAGAVPGWGGPEVLAELAVFDSPVGVSLDGDGQGNAIAVWAPANQAYAPVLARRYAEREGWRTVETIAPAGSGSVSTPTVRMNTRGDVVSVWDSYGGLRAASATAGGSWQSPVPIGKSSFGMWGWGLDDESRALLVWSPGTGVLVSRFEPSSGWAQATPLPGAQGQVVGDALAVAVSPSGRALVVWVGAETPNGGVWASSFAPREGWAAASRLGPQPPSSPVFGATVFINSEGDGLVSWVEPQEGPGGGVLRASRYARATGFGPAELLGPTAGLPTAGAIDQTGNVLVIYQSGPGLRRQRFLAERGWQPPEPFDGVGGYDAVPLDDRGNGWILWNESMASGAVSLRSRRVGAGVAMGLVEEAAPPFTGFAYFRGTPLDSRGGLLAAWFQRDPEDRYRLVANRYRAN